MLIWKTFLVKSSQPWKDYSVYLISIHIWTVIGYSFKFETSISIFQLIIKALFWIFKQLIEMNIWTFMKNKIVKLMKITYTAYQCHLFGTSIYLYFNPYCLATFSESEAVCSVQWTVYSVQWSVDLTSQCSFNGMGFTVCSEVLIWLLDGPVVSTLGCFPGVPGSKTPIQANCSGPGNFFSSCRALWCCSQSEKSLTKQARYTRQLLARDLFFLNSFLMIIY